MYLIKVLMISVIVMLSGCATQGVLPVATDIPKSRIYDAPYDQVWAAIIEGIAEANLSISTLEKDSGLIAMSNTGYEPRWADEGTLGSTMGVPDQITQRIANFNIFATRQGSEQTRVQVNSSFKMEVLSGNGSITFPYKRQWRQTYSYGILEGMILDGVARRFR